MEETTEPTKNRIVELRRQDPRKWTYAALKAETGIKQDSTITKILTQAGLAQPRGATSQPTPQPSPQANASKSSTTSTTPAATPTATTPPVQPTPGDGVSDLQPPPFKARPKAHPQQFNCSECRVPFVLDPGERIEDVKACPACGEAFE